jgi:spore maturation protein CgeB
MKFMKVHVPYPAYLSDLDTRRVLNPSEPYHSQLRAYLDDSFQQSDVASVGLRQLGWECQDFVATHVGMCRTWARERGKRLGRRGVVRDVTLSALEEFRPDVVLIYHHTFFCASWIQQLRKAVPGVKVAVWCGVNVERREDLAVYDVVLTCNTQLAARFVEFGVKAYHLPFAFDPAVRERVLGCVSEGEYGVTFLGQVVVQAGFHSGRASLLERVSASHPVDVFASWAGHSSGAIADGLLWRLRQRLMKRLPFLRGYSGQCRHSAAQSRSINSGPHNGRAIIHAPRYGLRYLRTMYDSVLTLNHQPQCAGSSASNMRLVEAAGVGACLLTDYKEDLELILRPNYEVMVYRDYDECLDKIAFVMRRPRTTRAIRHRAAERVRRDHNPLILAARLDSLLRDI